MKNYLTFILFLLLGTSVLVAQNTGIQSAINAYRYQEALSLLENEPQTPENLLLRASICEKLYNYSAALTIYNQLIQQSPNHVNLVVAMAECAAQAGNSEQALKGWIRADSLSSDNLFFQTKKSMAYYRNGNWDKTIQSANAVFQTDSVPQLLRMVGDAYLYTSQGDSAVYYYSRAIEKNPSDYLAVSKLGNIYYGAQFFDSVISLTDTYLNTVNPDQQLIGQLNGMAHYSVGNYKKATERLKQNVALGDSSYTTCYYLGMSLYAGKLYFEAVKWLENAYEQNPNDINLLYYYGTALSRTYDRKRGIEVLTEGATKIEEQYAMLYDFDRSFADAYLRSQNYAKAIEYYKSAFNRQPDKSALLYNIAHSYDAMKDYKNATSYYQRFLKTAPKGMKISSAPVDEKELEKMDSEEVYYRIAAERVEKLKEEIFFQSGKKN